MSVYDEICNILEANGFEKRRTGGMVRHSTGCRFSVRDISKYQTVAHFQRDYHYTLEDNRVFVLDMSDPAMKLRALASTAKFLPVEYLQNYLRDYTAMEKFEEAAIIRDEINSRK